MSRSLNGLNLDPVFGILSMSDRNPEESGIDESVTDEDFLSCSMMIKAKNTITKERIWINRVASEIVFQPGIQTMALC